MTQRVFKWFLFTMLVTTVPVLFFLFTAIGFFPVIGIIVISAISGDLALAAFGFVHVIVYGTLFYGVAYVVSKSCGGVSSSTRLGLATIIGITLVVITFEPLYGWGGYATSRFYSLYFCFRMY